VLQRVFYFGMSKNVKVCCRMNQQMFTIKQKSCP